MELVIFTSLLDSEEYARLFCCRSKEFFEENCVERNVNVADNVLICVILTTLVFYKSEKRSVLENGH